MSQSQAALLNCQDWGKEKKNTILFKLTVTMLSFGKGAVTNIMFLTSISEAWQLCNSQQERREGGGGTNQEQDGGKMWEITGT